MAHHYEIIPSHDDHAALLIASIREGDAREVTCMGVTIRKGVWRSYRNSIMRKTAFVDGELAAMWGLSGSFLGGIGNPWLLTTPAIERVPIAMIKEGRKHVREMLGITPMLENIVLSSYGRAVRFLEVLGFNLDEEKPINGGENFRRFWMKA